MRLNYKELTLKDLMYISMLSDYLYVEPMSYDNNCKEAFKSYDTPALTLNRYTTNNPYFEVIQYFDNSALSLQTAYRAALPALPEFNPLLPTDNQVIYKEQFLLKLQTYINSLNTQWVSKVPGINLIQYSILGILITKELLTTYDSIPVFRSLSKSICKDIINNIDFSVSLSTDANSLFALYIIVRTNDKVYMLDSAASTLSYENTVYTYSSIDINVFKNIVLDNSVLNNIYSVEFGYRKVPNVSNNTMKNKITACVLFKDRLNIALTHKFINNNYSYNVDPSSNLVISTMPSGVDKNVHVRSLKNSVYNNCPLIHSSINNFMEFTSIGYVNEYGHATKLINIDSLYSGISSSKFTYCTKTTIDPRSIKLISKYKDTTLATLNAIGNYNDTTINNIAKFNFERNYAYSVDYGFVSPMINSQEITHRQSFIPLTFVLNQSTNKLKLVLPVYDRLTAIGSSINPQRAIRPRINLSTNITVTNFYGTRHLPNSTMYINRSFSFNDAYMQYTKDTLYLSNNLSLPDKYELTGAYIDCLVIGNFKLSRTSYENITGFSYNTNVKSYNRYISPYNDYYESTEFGLYKPYILGVAKNIPVNIKISNNLIEVYIPTEVSLFSSSLHLEYDFINYFTIDSQSTNDCVEYTILADYINKVSNFKDNNIPLQYYTETLNLIRNTRFILAIDNDSIIRVLTDSMNNTSRYKVNIVDTNTATKILPNVNPICPGI